MSHRDRLALDPIAPDQEVGRWLAALEDGRRDTIRELDRVDAGVIDRRPDGPLDTIGTLLYHIGLIEADWVASDVLGLMDPPELAAWLPWPDRTEDGRLTPVTGLSLDEHLERLGAIRTWTLDRLRTLDGADFHRVRSMPDYDVAPDWAVHHILQHEAEHRAHIAWIRDTSSPGAPDGYVADK